MICFYISNDPESSFAVECKRLLTLIKLKVRFKKEVILRLTRDLSYEIEEANCSENVRNNIIQM